VEDENGLSYFAWDGMNLLSEQDSAGAVTADYAHGYAPIPGIGTLAGAKMENAYYQYPVYDHRGTVSRLTDEGGNVVAYYEYDAWGNSLRCDEAAEVENRFRYHSNWMKLHSGYLSPTRIYRPEIGSFLQRDPVRQDETNLYKFCQSLRCTDATGGEWSDGYGSNWLGDTEGWYYAKCPDSGVPFGETVCSWPLRWPGGIYDTRTNDRPYIVVSCEQLDEIARQKNRLISCFQSYNVTWVEDEFDGHPEFEDYSCCILTGDEPNYEDPFIGRPTVYGPKPSSCGAGSQEVPDHLLHMFPEDRWERRRLDDEGIGSHAKWCVRQKVTSPPSEECLPHEKEITKYERNTYILKGYRVVKRGRRYCAQKGGFKLPKSGGRCTWTIKRDKKKEWAQAVSNEAPGCYVDNESKRSLAKAVRLNVSEFGIWAKRKRYESGYTVFDVPNTVLRWYGATRWGMHMDYPLALKGRYLLNRFLDRFYKDYYIIHFDRNNVQTGLNLLRLDQVSVFAYAGHAADDDLGLIPLGGKDDPEARQLIDPRFTAKRYGLTHVFLISCHQLACYHDWRQIIAHGGFFTATTESINFYTVCNPGVFETRRVP